MFSLVKEGTNVSKLFNNHHFMEFINNKNGLTELLFVIIQFLLKHLNDVNKDDIITINNFLTEKDFSEFSPCFFCNIYSSDEIIVIPKNKNKIVKFDLVDNEEDKNIFLIIQIIKDDTNNSTLCTFNINELNNII